MFEYYKDKKREWRWRLKGSNGRIMASGEGYASKYNVGRAIMAIQKRVILCQEIKEVKK